MEPNTKTHIALVGPVDPFRGGVAQYTTSLHQALTELPNVELTTVSFKRQYPQWLYPGKAQKDDKASKVQGVLYLIDAYNPFSWRKAANRIAKSGAEVAVLDWWTLFWQPGFAYIARRLRKKGVKPVFLCHNLVNHKTGGYMGLVDKIMYPTQLWMLKQAEAYILQSSEQVEFIHRLNPNAEIVMRTHPIYDRFPAATNPLPRRGKLELLFFGFIRPYKGLPVLIEALKQLNDPEVYLTVVGEPWKDEAELEKELMSAGVPNLELHLQYVDDGEAANYFARADVLVLPYLSATGSGVVAAAYHYGKPVLATSVGGLNDVVKSGQTGWLVPPENPGELAGAIADITREQCADMQPAIEAFCKQNSWRQMAETIAGLASTK
jgi:glycosyltransferase involved in cell wall biosynthesis